MAHFYVPFANKLFALGEGKFDVSVISHAGHSPGHYKDIHSPIDLQSTPESREPTDWYSLQDQVAHKLAFIEAESRDTLILIGHSIGCWMILSMLQQMNSSRVSSVLLLFPVLEKMSQSPNGQSFLPYLWSALRKPFTCLVWAMAHFIPESVKKCVLGLHFHTTPSEHLECITQGVININEKGIYNVLHMAKQEMEVVTDPPLAAIDDNIDKIVFYYGMGDNWNVESCYREMATRYPGKQIHLCEQSIPHAFVETSSTEMAEYVYSKLI